MKRSVTALYGLPRLDQEPLCLVICPQVTRDHLIFVDQAPPTRPLAKRAVADIETCRILPTDAAPKGEPEHPAADEAVTSRP